MTQLTVTMSEDLDQWIQTRVSKGRFADEGDYLRELVRRDRRERTEDIERVRGLIEEGLSSGIVDRDAREVLREIIAGIPDEEG